ncbi:hypothetical protein [Paenibacillus sp. CMAA1364]
MIIYKMAPYLLLVGLLIIIMDGMWVIDNYYSYITYPKESYIYLILGICLILIAYSIIQRNRKRITLTVNNGSGTGKDNRGFINKLWRQREKFVKRLFIFLFVMLVIIFIYDSAVAYSLLEPILSVGFVGLSFVYIMKDTGEDTGEEDIQFKSIKVRYLMRKIDYREHPFSLPLILFIMIVLTFMLSKHFGFALSLEISGNNRYTMTLPSGAWLSAELAITCVFIYIIQHCNFLGIRQINQGDAKVMLIHFMEIIVCGSTFLIWLMTLIRII